MRDWTQKELKVFPLFFCFGNVFFYVFCVLLASFPAIIYEPGVTLCLI